MFIWSFRMSKRELIIFGVGLAAFVAALLLIFCSAGSDSTAAPLGEGYTAAAADEPQRRAFLEQFGWQLSSEQPTVREVIIPKHMDARLSEYNSIQLRQGYDLSALGGERLRLWTYGVTNHPAGGKASASLLVMDGVVVGGDISSARAGGFSHGFDPNLFAAETAAAQASVTVVDRSVPDRIPADENVPPEADGDDE